MDYKDINHEHSLTFTDITCIVLMLTLYEHIETVTKWLPFCQQHFFYSVIFLHEKCCILNESFTKI